MFTNFNFNRNLLKKFIIIHFLFYNINIISYFSIFYSYISYKNEIRRIEKFLKICQDLKIIRRFKKLINPKISIISAIYNRGRFISRFLNSIQHQNFNDIEIILVDDCSIDNGVNIINEYKKKDERIFLIKNKKNRGTFIVRNLGVLYSKGKYIILPDPDDILSKNILKIGYNYAEKNNYEIIRFSFYKGNNKYILKLGNKPVYQPELSYNMFYGSNELKIIDFAINNKFIKKEVYIKALNSLNHFYLNMYMTYMEDQIMNYILRRTAKSFYYSRKIGYLYLQNTISITKNVDKISLLRIKFCFIYLKFIFEYSKNIKLQKDMANLLFTYFCSIIRHNLLESKSKDDIIFYYNIINMYLKNEYITNQNKYLLNILKTKIEKKKKFF